MSLIYNSNSLADTDRLGGLLAEVLPAGTTVALLGTLGAGKTRLTQAVAAACGIAQGDVLSPTFVLYQQHQGTRTLHHYDAYRIADDDEFLELGPDESFDSSGITFVEWGDRVSDCLPRERVEIEIRVVGETSREFTITASGELLQNAIEELRGKLAESE